MEYTCGNCKEVKINKLMGGAVVGCDLTNFVVPHEMDGLSKKITFLRIPLSCPRTEDVVKSEKQAPPDKWVVRDF